ncbi:MAG: type III toxin-antitoxin system ToxN/AbiQ family toxin [Clostridium sp.]
MKLKIYKVSEEYIDYLRKYDKKNIKVNKGEKRPYLGVVLEIDNIKYFAPMASPKPKHMNMKNSIDFIKINAGEHGVINLNNMIPVSEKALIKYNIEAEENIMYKNLLYIQLKFIEKENKKILKNAKKLYEKVTIYNSEFFSSKCANFKLLEKVSLKYKSKE